MNYYKSTTIGKDETGKEYKLIRLQKVLPSGKNKVTNSYFINGKKVTNYDRWTCDEWIVENIDKCEYFTESKGKFY